MELYILNNEYTPAAVIDSFKSLLWVKRYSTYGDFEIYLPADERLIEYIKPDCLVTRDDDERVMIIEKFQIQTDAENGDMFIVSGRSLESVLLRRIVWSQKIITASELITGIKELVDFCTASETLRPEQSDPRIIPGLAVDTGFSYQAAINTQFTGDTLLDAITAMCSPYDIGFRMTLSGASLILSFYKGKEVPVIFSPEFDNLISSDYTFDSTEYASVVRVLGEGEGSGRKGYSYNSRGDLTGLSRREIYVDARDISSNSGDVSQNDYFSMLSQRGMQKLYEEHSTTETFESQTEPDMTYHYKTDYNLGDIVTVTNGYGVTAKPRITEIIESWDETGCKVVPTFEK